ncbi:ATP-binding protein [Actinoplanes sp. CA-252034]|uniref:ATP-binding protein n=1 Tax=Actinoplanes sp. CA-252034 TaxID=3239906 RepID=UPI003D99DF1A
MAGILKGAGLGLTLVKILVEAHGGTITIDPDQQPGTRIVVRLPVVGSAQPVCTTATQDRSAPLPGTAHGAGSGPSSPYRWSPSPGL